MREIASWIAAAAAAVILCAASAQASQPFIADDPQDLGAEPNSTSSTTASPDIWVRRNPDPNYNPAPFDAANPSWTPLPHQNPRHADPRLSEPNWVYVRVRNRGSGPTPAGARLKLYWSKVGSGQAWPTTWVDYMPGSGKLLHGMEITKPRRNAATVSKAERDAYVQAILAIDTAGYAFPDGVSFWDKQNQTHASNVVMPLAHRNPAFLPWHREFINRYEVLLQTVDPTLKLLYWDWQQDPRQPINGFSYFSPDFMGAIGSGNATPVREPFVALMSPVQVMRNGRPLSEPFGTRNDSSMLSRANYHDVSGTAGLRSFIESGSRHNGAHVDLGGPQPSTCATQPSTCFFALSWVQQAARDPFFFLLHGNVDRLWAQWQRAQFGRYDARAGAAPYGLDSANVNIQRTMPPWDGSAGIAPWTAGSAETRPKTSLDPSVVSPPIYDTAPLTIPVLQTGQAVILQIPWYPPNPQKFSSGSASRQSFSLLARIETATTPPYGMTSPEVSTVSTNIRNNNKIARRNVTVLDPTIVLASGSTARSAAVAASAAPSAAAASTESVALVNDFDALVMSSLCAAPGSAPVEVKLPPELEQRWQAEGAPGESLRRLSGGRVEIGPGGRIDGLPLNPGESFDLEARSRGGATELTQLGAPGDSARVVVRTGLEGAAPAGAVSRTQAQAPAPAQTLSQAQADAPQFVRPGQVVTLGAAGLAAKSEIDTATFVIDGKVVETRRRPPFDIRWRAQGVGGHDVQIRIRDKAGVLTTVSRVVTVAENLPPEARLLAPADEATFRLGAPIPVKAEASDPDGRVARVDFYLSPMEVFADPVKVASATKPPYAASLRDVAAGMWMLTATAVDDKGVESQSIPIHLTVLPR